MKLQNALALVLAIGLQLAPVGRMISPAAAVNPAGIGIVFRWLACAAALLGGYDTVSGASAAIAGVAATNSGFYSVIVSNSAGSLASSNAQLLVVTPPDASVAPALTSAVSAAQLQLSWPSLAGYRYVLESSDTLATNSWTTVADVPPVFTNRVVTLPQGPDGRAATLLPCANEDQLSRVPATGGPGG